MADVLIVADTVRSPELRHEVPLAVPDPFLYAEVGGKRSVVVSSLESGRIAELGAGLEVLTLEDVGIDELLKRGLDPYAHERELCLNACRHLGLESAVTPATLPARARRPPARERDRARGRPGLLRRAPARQDRDRARRDPPRLPRGRGREWRPASTLLRTASRSNGVLTLGGEPLTCERIKLEVERVFGEHGAAADEFIVSHGAQTAVGHDGGLGPDRRRRRRPLRPLPARPRVGLLTRTSRERSSSATAGTSCASTTGSRRRRSTSPWPRSSRA